MGKPRIFTDQQEAEILAELEENPITTEVTKILAKRWNWPDLDVRSVRDVRNRTYHEVKWLHPKPQIRGRLASIEFFKR